MTETPPLRACHAPWPPDVCVRSGSKLQSAEVIALSPVPYSRYLLPKSNTEEGRDGLRRLVAFAGILTALIIIIIQFREFMGSAGEAAVTTGTLRN